MARPTPQELHHSGRFALLESFTIDEMNGFILRELGLKPAQPKSRKLTPASVLAALVLGGLGAAFGYSVGRAATDGGGSGWQLLALVPDLMLILAVHEAIHAVVFKALGAKDVGFGFSPKALLVYAYAQRFVMPLRENAIAAAMPFLVLTPTLLLIWRSWPQYGLLWGMALLIHTLGCVGDFALVKHAVRNRRRAVFTYDDLDEKRSYFFEATR